MMVDTFKAYRIFNEDNRVQGRIVDLGLNDLSPGDVVVKTAYSSVNYKDALAGTGAGKILRRFPLVGGIDLAGTVASSTSPRFREGDEVLATGYDLGVAHDGGYATYARVPAEWLVPVPRGLSLFEAMVLGTAGFTAGLSIVRMEVNGLTPEAGPVIVTGATGGVGSAAVAMLAALGYRVTAVTGKDDEHEYLRALGATEVLSRTTLEMGTRPLEKAMWAGAVDVVGGALLAWLTRTMAYGASIASSGLTGGIELNTTVLPFILRGVNLLGIDSAMCPMATRETVWRRLATSMTADSLKLMARTVTLEGLPEVFQAVLKGKARGRTVVALS
jgi:NADPH2:quinone reductase